MSSNHSEKRAAIIRADGSKTIGMGHLSRACLVSEALEVRGYNARLLVKRNADAVCFLESRKMVSDFLPYFEGLVRSGVLHRTPESAARKLNEIASDPLQWWRSHAVRSAVALFRENVCHTSQAGLTEWAKHIGERGE